jgi:hypothetical protein
MPVVGAVGQAPPIGLLAKFGDPLVGELATPVVLEHHGDRCPVRRSASLAAYTSTCSRSARCNP